MEYKQYQNARGTSDEKNTKSSKYPAAFLALRLWKCSYADRNNRAGDNGGCQCG